MRPMIVSLDEYVGLFLESESAEDETDMCDASVHRLQHPEHGSVIAFGHPDGDRFLLVGAP